MQVPLGAAAVPLPAVWAAMQQLGVLTATLEHWAGQLHHALLTPALRGATPTEAAGGTAMPKFANRDS
jgi:hypothetical protein